ncbi:hypothetical protein CXB51_008058 [Gossypium anomalum]|uniref:Protein kinase domain-containing protein n=1 Tax=Gossypium anomalum TaxID=47600 RepID=A0A8J6D5U2_9ROSI|nr:hypothetical protein CXB51_008058 [Gossypium anomalum]
MEIVNRDGVGFMWGYLPGALPQRAPLVSPVLVRIPDSIDHSWTDVCGGGCGFAMAISGILGMRQIQFRMTIWSPWNFMHKFPNTTLQHLIAFTDMWAVGAILAELFTSSPIFPGERIGHYTIPKEMNEVCNWLTARLGLDG